MSRTNARHQARENFIPYVGCYCRVAGPNEVRSSTALDDGIPVPPHLDGEPRRRADDGQQAMKDLILY